MNVLLIDNYDSFTYNLYQYVAQFVDHVEVVRNSEVPIQKIEKEQFSHIIISPGPGNPTDPEYFGKSAEVIKRYHTKYPILGVCLGHQGIGSVFGAKIIHAPTIMHGKTSVLKHNQTGLLANLPSEITVMRYHSLAVDKDTLSEVFQIDAIAEDDSIMAMHHVAYPLFGLQFHPESFKTATGLQIIRNFFQFDYDFH